MTTAPSAPIDPLAYAQLEHRFRGALVLPGGADYDRHRRVWNGSIDRRPALIARCAGVADVLAAVRFARRTGLEVAVRSGGHSFPGLSVCDGGIVIDVGAMRGIRVDLDRGTVRAQAGVLLGDLDRETQAFGVTVPVGAVSHTGLTGLTLGGGIGWQMRRLGLTIDQLVSVDLVTADAKLLTASADREPELFWGLRGGGGNFGVVTDLECRLHRVGPTVLGGLLLWPLDRGAEVARLYRDWCADAPDELTTALVVRRVPAVDLFPVELHGQPVVGVICCWTGPIEEGERLIRPLRTVVPPVVDLCLPRPLVEQQSLLDPSYPHGLWAYLRACNLDALTDAVIDACLEEVTRTTSNRSGVILWQLGGAVARVGDRDTAFAGRSSRFIVNITGATDTADGFEDERAWVRSFWEVLAAHGAGVYVNFLMDEGAERVREAYGPQRYRRLQALKARYDPDNLFHLNQNIPPAPRSDRRPRAAVHHPSKEAAS